MFQLRGPEHLTSQPSLLIGATRVLVVAMILVMIVGTLFEQWDDADGTRIYKIVLLFYAPWRRRCI